MLLQHTTPRKNLVSILKRGLLCGKSQGKMKVVWLHAVDRTSWAFLHAVKRHGGRIEDVVTIAVDVPGSAVRRSSVAGLYYVCYDIAPADLGDVARFEAVAASPLEGVET